jgi:hypothetical protein
VCKAPQRHCELREAIHCNAGRLDCLVAKAPRKDELSRFRRPFHVIASEAKQSGDMRARLDCFKQGRAVLQMKNNLERLDLSSFSLEEHRFESGPGNSVLDPGNGARLSVYIASYGPEGRTTVFRFEDFELKGMLSFELKHPELGSDDPIKNPGLKILSSPWDSEFRQKEMTDRAFNTRLVRYIIHMIAFDRAKNAPRKIFLWSDFDQFSRRRGETLFEMPSDAELLKISEFLQ